MLNDVVKQLSRLGPVLLVSTALSLQDGILDPVVAFSKKCSIARHPHLIVHKLHIFELQFRIIILNKLGQSSSDGNLSSNKFHEFSFIFFWHS